MKTLPPYDCRVSSQALSPDKTVLAVGYDNGVIRLYSLPEGTLRAELTEEHSRRWPPSGNVSHLVFSPDGAFLAYRTGHSVHVRRMPDGLECLNKDGYGDFSLYFSFDGHVLFCDEYIDRDLGGLRDRPDDHRVSIVWSSDSPDVTGDAFRAYNGKWEQMLDPGGRILINWGGNDKSIIRLMNLDGTVLHELRGHTNFAVAPDGQFLATGGSGDGTVQLWSLPDATLLKTLQTGEVDGILFSPDGAILVSMDDKTMRLWKLPDGGELARLERPSHMRQLQFSLGNYPGMKDFS